MKKKLALQFWKTLPQRARLGFIFLAFLGISGPAWAATLPTGEMPLRPEQQDEKTGTDGEGTLAPSLLWSISGNGLKDSSWLFGTIHLIGQNDFFVRPAVERVFSGSSQVVFEIKLDDMAMLLSMGQLLMLPENQTLASLLEPSLYERLRTWMEDSLGMSMTAYERQKPLALMQATIMEILPENPASYELHFLMQAKAQQKPIFGLESVADQVAMFDSIPLAEQVLWTLEMMESKDSFSLSFQAMVDAYKSEDLEQLMRLMIEESPEFEAYSSALLDERNVRWIPNIEKLIQERGTFVAVGAGHLAGPQGVINLLRAQGYRVEPVLK